MAVILFPDFDAVRLVLASGAVPAAIANSPVRWAADAKGRVWLEPSVTLPRSVATALSRFGALVQGTSGVELAEPVEAWPLVLPLETTPATDTGLLGEAVLFDLPRSAFVPRFVAEMRRLGVGKIGIRSASAVVAVAELEQRCQLLVENPPYSTLLRAIDRVAESPRAYRRQAPRVWVEVGHRHPLAELIAPPAGHVAVLSAPRRYHWLHDAPFQTGPSAFALPRGPTDATELPADEWSLPIQLQLSLSTDNDAPELWVIPERQLDQLSALIHRWDDRMVAQLKLAHAVCDGHRVAIVQGRRVRDGGPIVLFDDVIAYRPVLRMPNLFAPVGLQLRPLLRRDVLRQWLAADSETLVWLWPTTHGQFERHGLPLSAFRPMNEFVRYRAEPPLIWAPLDSPAVLPLSPFVVREPAPPLQKPVQKSPPPAPKASPSSPASEGWLQKLGKWFSPIFGRADEPITIPDAPARTVPAPGPLEPAPLPRHAWERERAELESRLLSADLSNEERNSLWPELAGLYAALNQPTDASTCWLHSLWHHESEAARWARGWLSAEARTANPEADLEQWLSSPTSPTKARALAAFLVWVVEQQSPVGGSAPWLERVQHILDEQESNLPVRAVWLSRLAISNLLGHDAVGLARCRDRLLSRLYQNGLSADVDAPSFVRFAGQVTDERRQQVRDFLERVRQPMQRWVAHESPSRDAAAMRLPQFGLGVASASNRGYADLIAAWGMARLGQRTLCEQWMSDGRREFPPEDDVHGFLRDAYAFRAHQALEGHAHRGPLAAELRERLAQLAARERADAARRELRTVYTIERYRQMSRILEPEERVRAFEEGHLDRSTPLRGISDRDELAARLNALLDVPDEQLPAALAVGLDLAPRVGESFASWVLDRLLSVIDRWGFAGPAEQVELEVGALERGWFVAAHFDRTEAARRLLDCLGRLLDARRDVAATNHAAESALLGLVGQALRGLRRLGLRADADRLLDRLAEWSSPKTPDVPRTALLLRRLHITGGWFYVGRDLEATSALDDARLVLLSRRLGSRDQSNLASAYVAALGHAPVRIALGRIQEVFEQVENVADQHTTNSHFSLSRLRVVEAAVLAVVNDDFALGPTVRRWLDDDEFRVRQRIHRDMARFGATI